MSEQDRIAFEKKCYPSGLGLSKNNTPDSDLDGYQDAYVQHAWNAWQAATAEANKRIEALEGEFARKDSLLRTLENVAEQLQANNHDLREALEDTTNRFSEMEEFAKFIASDHKCIARNQTLLSTTPAESLQAHDDEVIEKCAKVCNDMLERRGVTFDHKFMADTCAYAIRALKEVK